MRNATGKGNWSQSLPISDRDCPSSTASVELSRAGIRRSGAAPRSRHACFTPESRHWTQWPAGPKGATSDPSMNGVELKQRAQKAVSHLRPLKNKEAANW